MGRKPRKSPRKLLGFLAEKRVKKVHRAFLGMEKMGSDPSDLTPGLMPTPETRQKDAGKGVL
jgi:hypothetical protein